MILPDHRASWKHLEFASIQALTTPDRGGTISPLCAPVQSFLSPTRSHFQMETSATPNRRGRRIHLSQRALTRPLFRAFHLYTQRSVSNV